MKRTASVILAGLLAVAAAPGFAAPDGVQAAKPRGDAAQPQWSVWGGEAAFRWNEDLLRVLGIELVGVQASRADEYGYRRLAVRESAALRFAVRQGSFEGFTGGGLALQGGFELRSKRGAVSLRALRLVPRADDPFLLDVVGDDGIAWFFVDRLMYEIERGPTPLLDIRTMDMRIGPAFAEHLADPTLLGHSIADVALRTHIHASDGNYAALAAKGTTSKWPGALAPDGSRYQADVFMQNFSTVWKRQSTAANGAAVDGPGGANGSIVYAPSSTLRNNRSNGTPVQTIADPMGTSSALWAANVAWYQKFSGVFAPYGNDQHPYLIWNLYRTDAAGRLVQIARSGVKHAFLTINTSCDEHPGSSHILGRGCADTYSDGNNDSIGDLGPRREIIPATGQWGRCGSVYDADCNGARDSGSPCSNVGGATCSGWAFRLAAREDDIQATTNAGASYRMESWYIVRDDIDIFNTMQTQAVAFTWNSSNGMWQVAGSGGLQLGPAIDRWVARDTIAPLQSSASISTGDGHARVAVQVADLGAGQYRYTYAVMNFDFARAVTQGAEPNLRVLSNDGFTALSVPRGDGVTLSDAVWFNADGAAWTFAAGGDAFRWDAPAGNALNWGTLHTFSFVANAAPVAASVRLTTAPGTGTAETIEVTALVPGPGAGAGFAVGGMLSGVAGSDGVELRLNGGAPVTRSADGPYAFQTALADGAPYDVDIVRAPTGRSCTIANDQGVVAGANVSDVDVACSALPPQMVPVGGSVQGLDAGRSVSLSLDGGAPVTRSANGAFVFPNEVAVGATYAVQVTTQPVAQLCSLVNGSGTVPAAGVDDLVVDCVARPTTMHSVQVGLVGLAAASDIVLQLNGGNGLRLTQDGEYVFGVLLASGTRYEVSVSRQPQGQACVVTDGSGTIDASDASGARVTCTDLPPSYSIGGTVTGLGAGHSVTLSLNGSQPLLRTSNGAFAFTQTQGDDTAYEVTMIDSQGVDCEVLNGSGTVQGASVSTVGVHCAPRWPGFDDGFEGS